MLWSPLLTLTLPECAPTLWATRPATAHETVSPRSSFHMGPLTRECQLRAAPGRVVPGGAARERPRRARCDRRPCPGAAPLAADCVRAAVSLVDRAAPGGRRECAERLGHALRRVPRVPGTGAAERAPRGHALPPLPANVSSQLGRALPATEALSRHSSSSHVSDTSAFPKLWLRSLRTTRKPAAWYSRRAAESSLWVQSMSVRYPARRAKRTHSSTRRVPRPDPRACGSTRSRRSCATLRDRATRNTDPTTAPSCSAIQQRSRAGSKRATNRATISATRASNRAS